MKKEHKNISYREGWLSIGINIALFIFKYVAGTLSGSIAIIADAWHSLSDSITSIVVIVGTKVSGKPPDREHPFGHERATLISSIVIGVLLFVVAFGFLEGSIKKLVYRERASYTYFSLYIVLVSILVKELLAQYAMYAYKKTGLEMLKADAWHHRSDALSSSIVLMSILLGKMFWWIDGVAGIVISLLLAHAGYEVFKSSVGPLLGEAPNKELIYYISNLSKEVSDLKTLYAHHFHIHNYGTHKELTFHLKFPDNMTIKECHDIATKIESKIKEELGMEATIHLESFS